jgi:hypothetical protein
VAVVAAVILPVIHALVPMAVRYPVWKSKRELFRELPTLVWIPVGEFVYLLVQFGPTEFRGHVSHIQLLSFQSLDAVLQSGAKVGFCFSKIMCWTFKLLISSLQGLLSYLFAL